MHRRALDVWEHKLQRINVIQYSDLTTDKNYSRDLFILNDQVLASLLISLTDL